MFSKSPVSVVELSGKSTVTKNTIKTEILRQALQKNYINKRFVIIIIVFFFSKNI